MITSRVMNERRHGADGACLKALGLLWLFHVAANVWWLSADSRPPTYDTAGHAITCLRLANHVEHGELRAAARLLLTRDYPPLLYVAVTPAVWIAGRSADALTTANVVFLGLVLLATYGVAREVAGPVHGLLAAAVLSWYPYVYGLSRQLLTDLPLTATVALALWLLVRAASLERPLATLALGVAFGLGLLAKTTFALWVAAPSLVAALYRRRGRARRLIALGLAAVPALVMAGFWYWRNLAAQLEFARFQTIAAAAEGDPRVGSLESWSYYLNAAAEVQVMLPLLVACCLGTAATLADRRLRADGRVWVVVAWVVVGYVLISLQPNKDPRYSMPALPAMAVLTSWGVSTLRRRRVQIAGVAVLGAWSLFQFGGLTFGLRGRLLSPAARLPVAVRAGDALRLVLYSEDAHMITPPRQEDWQATRILREISEQASRPPAGAQGVRVVVIPDAPHFEPNVFMYQALAEGLDTIDVRRVTGVREIHDVRARIAGSDFVVAKTGDEGPPWTVDKSRGVASALANSGSELGRLFTKVGEYPLPDRSVALLYRRR